MAIDRNQRLGKIEWFDLTVPDANEIRNFYQQVIGWTSSPVDMGGYEDHCMIAKDAATVAGICHARGMNAELPPQWMVYINVDDLDASLKVSGDLGGERLSDIRHMLGHGRYCFIRDPAGAVCALFEPERSKSVA